MALSRLIFAATHAIFATALRLSDQTPSNSLKAAITPRLEISEGEGFMRTSDTGTRLIVEGNRELLTRIREWLGVAGRQAPALLIAYEARARAVRGHV
jgi:hypothetical protein